MSLSNLNVKISYTSRGEDDIISDFLVPALKQAVLYKRSVGFFSSSVFELLGDGLNSLVSNDGEIRIICSPELSKKDVEGIQLGYALKEGIIQKIIEDDIGTFLDQIDDKSLLQLVSLIAKNKLNVVVVDLDNSRGMYHDKIGIIADKDGNEILFVGSPNESLNAYEYNYEKVRVSVSWNPSDRARIEDDEKEFDDIWDGTNRFIRKKDYTDIISKRLSAEVKRRKLSEYNPEKTDKNKDPIKLRQYQKDAIAGWVKNGYKGFFVMATGTGKTWTAIYAAMELISKEPLFLVICAPYKHLIRQWYEDIHKVLPDCNTILISGENHDWENQLVEALLNVKYGKKTSVVAISTIKSFCGDKFERIAKKSVLDRMLIMDEAHRFNQRTEEITQNYRYMLGLSATPYSRKGDQNGRELMDFFGGQVYNLPIEYAIAKNHLVHYNYYPIYVNASEEEEKKFDRLTSLMASCYRNGICIDTESLAKHKRSRLRVISMAQEKTERIRWILSQIYEDDHFIVYCGDGKLFYGDKGEETRHIQFVKEILTGLDYKVSQFTADESMKERMQIVNAFNRGIIDAMVAIRCLDEGINIPSIKGALLLASNDDYREFVQRRGRILRTYTDEYTGEEKKVANIYDVIVLPPTNKLFANIELRRFYEYCSLADNKEECVKQLDDLMVKYSLEIEDIVDVEENEEELDE